MMATWADRGVPSKKKLTTYGKASRKRFEAGAAPGYGTDSSASSRAGPAVDSAKDGDAGARRAAKAGERPKISTARSQNEPPKTQISSSIWDVDGAFDGPYEKPARDTARQMKRKPSQIQPSNRLPKKQRSSSPDSLRPAQTTAKGTGVEKASSAAGGTAAVSSKTTPPKAVARVSTSDSMPFSPGTVRALDTLSVGTRKAPATHHQMPIRPPKSQVPPRPTLAKEAMDIDSSPRAVQSPPSRPRQRLIDLLAAQAEESSSEEDEDEDGEEEGGEKEGGEYDDYMQAQISSLIGVSSGEDRALVDRRSPGPASQEQTRARVPPVRYVGAKKSAVKFTYSQERTVLADEPLAELALSLDAAAGDSISQPLFPKSQSNLSAFSFDDDGEEEPASRAIRSVHELRQAGANNRVTDELDDILDRIGSPGPGKPSSTRRSALIELAKKLQDKKFLGHFRDHGGEARLFRDLGKEEDIIAGYALCCNLIILVANTVSSTTVEQLPRRGTADFFARLLAHGEDMTRIARERKNIATNQMRTSLASLKLAMQKLPIWKPADAAPAWLSPRTMALKALQLVVPQLSTGTSGDEMLSPAVSDQFFKIVASASESQDSNYWGFPSETESVDLCAALALLEPHSMYAMQSALRSDWTDRYVPVIADVLETALRRGIDQFGDLECMVLKLTLNVANSNPPAQRVFMDKGLLEELAELVCGMFASILTKLGKGDEFPTLAVSSLVLMLGVMINFSEGDPTAGNTLFRHKDSEVLDKMIKLFFDYRATTVEADSVEKSHINVAFGYLSVLLGHLCFCGAVKDRFESAHSGYSLDPLLGSLKEFIAFHEAAEKAIEAHGGESTGSTTRLVRLVEELENRD